MKLDSARIEWTDAAKRRALPRRGGALNPKKTAQRIRTRTAAEFREELSSARQNFANWLLQQSILTETMRDEHRAVALAMKKDWEQENDRPLVLEHEALAMYWWCTHWHIPDDPHAKLVDGWLAVEGPAFALRALLRARALGAELTKQPDAKDGLHVDKKHVIAARAIRVALVSASTADYDATRQLLEAPEGRAADPWTRTLLSMVFPEDKTLGEQAGLHALSTDRKSNIVPWPWVLNAGIPLDIADKLFRSNYPVVTTEFASTALELHGVALVPALLDVFARAGATDSPVDLAAALASVVHPEVARAFEARRNDWRKPLKLDAVYLAQHAALLEE